MPNLRQIKRRVRSVQSTAKITKAMSVLAASKMKRAQDSALKGRPYEERIQLLLAHLAAQPTGNGWIHPLLKRRDIHNIEVIHITPDRGLTGGLNMSVNRATLRFTAEKNVDTSIIAIGKKGRDFMLRYGFKLKAEFVNLGDRPSVADISPVARIVIDNYTEGTIDAAYLVYARFVSTTVQESFVQPLLPVIPARLKQNEAVGYIFEPDVSTVISELLPRFVEMEIYHALLESVASEQSARMVAMRNATDNANQMIDDLTLTLNKVRQNSITNDLLDIVGGATAIGAMSG